jgi:hypothetical protein
MNAPGRAVNGWWDCHNNALYLEKLVHQSSADEKADAAEGAPAKPLSSLLWRPLSFPRSGASKARGAKPLDVPRAREGSPERAGPA